MPLPGPNEKERNRERLSGILNLLHRLEDMMLVALFLVMLGMAVFQIVLRCAFSAGVAWGDVMVRILVLWICLFGAMVATRQDNHININLISMYLPERTREIAGGVVRMAAAIICLVMTGLGINLVRLDLEYGTVAFAGMPAWVCELIIPFGFAVIAIRYILISIDRLFKRSKRPA